MVEPLARATAQDITGVIGLDSRLFGRVGLISVSWKDLQEAVRHRTPPIVALLRGYKTLHDSGLHLRRFLRVVCVVVRRL